MSETITETGLRIEGNYENQRNADNSELFKAVIREAFGVTDVIVAHHLVYVTEELRSDSFKYQIVEEIPAADTLLFDHEIAKKLWGEDYLQVLQQLAIQPCETRDHFFRQLYLSRGTSNAALPQAGAVA